MQIVIVTDAWYPQINGVVRTLDTLSSELRRLGHLVLIVSPNRFLTIPCPTYPEIRLSLSTRRGVGRVIDEARPAAIHIATEGPLGLCARLHCMKRGFPFTTSFHTRFPEYIEARCGIAPSWGYRLLRWFHRPASQIMVSTGSLEQDLRSKGFKRLVRWTRGVDTALFRPRDKSFLPFPRPISLFVGRVAVEKNLEAFLSLDLPGTKVVVGDGPQLRDLQARFPEVRFLGTKSGEDLACHYAAADVFVFPSLTDTFGLVILEALASGVPVAAYPVRGPRDVIDGAPVGCLDEDLQRAVHTALDIPAERCRTYAEQFSWGRSAQQFLSNLDQMH